MPVTSSSLRILGVTAVAVTAFMLGRWNGRATSEGTSSAVAQSAQKSVSAASTASPSSSSEAPAESSPKKLAVAAAEPAGSFAAEEDRQRSIEQWAERDPRAAIDFVRTKLKGDRQAQAMASTLAIWGKNDPDAAWDWLTKELPTATHHFDTVLEAIGRKSTDNVGKYIAKFVAAHPEAVVEGHLAALLGVTYRGDFNGARSLVENATSLDPESRSNLINFVAGQWGRFAPEEAKAWVMKLPPGPQRDQALIGLGESWSEVNPAQAAAFAVSLPSGPTRTLALRQAISKWMPSDPEGARAWVMNTERHEDFDQAVGSIATDTNLVNRDPNRALKWASTIFDDTLRTNTVNTILFNWYPANPAAATAYLQASPEFTPEQRAHILSHLQGKN